MTKVYEATPQTPPANDPTKKHSYCGLFRIYLQPTGYKEKLVCKQTLPTEPLLMQDRYIDKQNNVSAYQAYLAQIAIQWNPIANLIPCGMLVQSSGSGKTSLAIHTARSIYTIYIGPPASHLTATFQQGNHSKNSSHNIDTTGIESVMSICSPDMTNENITMWAHCTILGCIAHLCSTLDFEKKLTPAKWIEMQLGRKVIHKTPDVYHGGKTQSPTVGKEFWNFVALLTEQVWMQHKETTHQFGNNLNIAQVFAKAIRDLSQTLRAHSSIQERGVFDGNVSDGSRLSDFGLVFVFDDISKWKVNTHLVALIKALEKVPTVELAGCAVIGIMVDQNLAAVEHVIDQVAAQRLDAMSAGTDAMKPNLLRMDPFLRILSWNAFLDHHTPRLFDILQFGTSISKSDSMQSLHVSDGSSGSGKPWRHVSPAQDICEPISKSRKVSPNTTVSRSCINVQSIWPHLSTIGRPLWKSMLQNYSIEKVIESAAELICGGASKARMLLDGVSLAPGGSSNSEAYDFTSTYISLLTIRLCLDFTSTFPYNLLMCSSHMAIYFSINAVHENNCIRKKVESGYVSEPIISEGAGWILRNKQFQTGSHIWCKAIHALYNMVNDSHIKASADPTLVARILLLKTMDRCTEHLQPRHVPIAKSSKNPRLTSTAMPSHVPTLPTKLSTFLHALLPNKKYKEAVKKFPAQLMDSLIFFNHFIRLGKANITPAVIQASLNFCSGVIVSPYKLVLPILTPACNGRPARLSAVLVRVDMPGEEECSDETECTLFSDCGFVLPSASAQLQHEHINGHFETYPSYLVINLRLSGSASVTIKAASDIDPMRSVMRMTGVSVASFAPLNPATELCVYPPQRIVEEYSIMVSQLALLCNESKALAFAIDSARVMDDVHIGG
ncbi:hypothetical protein O5D80_002875 [Batrachochytrium dendrobatidis]|nr:hypothetical protein O5D80_002875 [Batrachochytrium dendrobatidis]